MRELSGIKGRRDVDADPRISASASFVIEMNLIADSITTAFCSKIHRNNPQNNGIDLKKVRGFAFAYSCG